MIVGGRLAASFMLGLVLAGVQEARDSSLKIERCPRLLRIFRLCSIPLLENTLLVKRKKRVTYLAWSAAVILGIVAICSALFYYSVSNTNEEETLTMSRVHDALRRAEQLLESPPSSGNPPETILRSDNLAGLRTDEMRAVSGSRGRRRARGTTLRIRRSRPELLWSDPADSWASRSTGGTSCRGARSFRSTPLPKRI